MGPLRFALLLMLPVRSLQKRRENVGLNYPLQLDPGQEEQLWLVVISCKSASAASSASTTS